MSLIKQLLTPFIEFEDEKNKEPQKGKQQIASPVVPAAVTSIPPVDENVHHPLITDSSNTVNSAGKTPVYSPSGTLASPMPEHQQYFDKLMDEANRKNPLFQGADYKEFVDGKVDIDDITDEALKYRTAFNILQSLGLTKERLLSTGQEYLNIIGHDMNVFQSAHAQQYGKEVRPKELLIQKKAEELQALTQRLNILKGEINNLTQEINLTREKLDTGKNSFLLAGENKQKEIQTELEKIARYF